MTVRSSLAYLLGVAPSAPMAVTYGGSSPVSDGNGWFARVIGASSKAGPVVSEYTAFQQPAVYACVNRISNPVAGFPLKIFKQDPNNPAGIQVDDHPLSRKLGLRPNDFMSSRTLRKTAQGHALLWGNGYIEIERNNRGQAVGLYPLLPWSTNPERDGDKLLYRTTIDGRQFKIDQADVLHIMDLSQDGYCGVSPIRQAANAIGLAQATEEFGSKFFANDAKSGGFLMHPGRLSATAMTNLGAPKGDGDKSNPVSRLEKQGGLDNAHRLKVLEEGMTFVQTTIPPEDAQFLETRQMQIAEIARMYDVPLILLQAHEGTTMWGTGIEQLMDGFVRQTIAPWVNAWEQEMNWKLFTSDEIKQGYYVKFNMNALLRGDMAARADFYSKALGAGGGKGWMTENEVRALEELAPHPDGDGLPVPTNTAAPGNVSQPMKEAA